MAGHGTNTSFSSDPIYNYYDITNTGNFFGVDIDIGHYFPA